METPDGMGKCRSKHISGDGCIERESRVISAF